MQNKLPGSLQDKFQDFGSAPSEQLWNNIEANLDKDKKRRRVIWWWFLGAAAVVTLFFGVYQLGYKAGVSENDSAFVNKKIQNSNHEIQNDTNGEFQNSNNQNPNENGQQNSISSEQNLANQNNDEHNSENDTDLKNNPEQISSNNNIDKSNNLQTTKIPQKNRQHSDIVESVINEPDVVIPEKFTLEDNSFNNEIKKFAVPEIATIDQSISEPHINFEPPVEIQNLRSKKHWEIGFNFGTLIGTNAFAENTSYDSNLTIAAPDDLNTENSINGTGISAFSSLSETTAKIFRPIQAEFTIAHKIGHRWNFQSGLGLGILVSSNLYSSGNATSVRSKFLSISIPLHFNYDLIQRNRFTFYTGIGVNYEVPVIEKIKTSYLNPALESASTKNFTKGYMISAQLNTGFRFNLNENIKLDFRPNVRYYIHQSMSSVYPALERKLWFGASLGVIWQL